MRARQRTARIQLEDRTFWVISPPPTTNIRELSEAVKLTPGSDGFLAERSITLMALQLGRLRAIVGHRGKLSLTSGSVNPSHVILNNWSNGDPGFTQGPPTKDTILRGKIYDHLC